LSEASEGQIRMSELADSVHQSRSRMTHTVARLERDGLVTRWSCDSDRRGVWARLTDEGWRALVAAAPTHVAGVRELLVDAIDPDDLRALDRVFTAVAEQATGSREAVAPGRAGVSRESGADR
ncbi:MAG: MarR family winged helix-turn-helix transcriptional regulator, partial [Nocardioidaceae bacterium]